MLGDRACRGRSGRAERAGGGVSELGQWDMGCWAHAERSEAEARGMELGRAGPCGRERERRRPGPVWAAGFRVWLGWVLGFAFSISTPPSLFLIQTKFEFKYKFEFKPHSNI